MEKQAFILANTQLKPVEAIPELMLYQADEVHELWHMSEKQLQEKDIPPPFWAFPWAGGGIGLARFILDNPHFVQGKRVIDFASGSGLVGLAALKAGAKSVTAIDIDPFAAIVAQLNAKANNLEIISKTEDIIGLNSDSGLLESDLIVAGDIFYDRAFSQKVISWFSHLAKQDQTIFGQTILVGDPGRNYRPQGLHKLADYQIAVSPVLEEGTSKTVMIWKF